MSDITTTINTAILELEAGVPEADVLVGVAGIVDLFNDVEPAIAKGIEVERPVLFQYKGKADQVYQLRMVSPWTLEDGLLFGYDHEREAVRTFRLDRIFQGGGAFGPAEVYVEPEDQP